MDRMEKEIRPTVPALVEHLDFWLRFLPKIQTSIPQNGREDFELQNERIRLANRDWCKRPRAFKFRMNLARSALAGYFLVDPQQCYLMGGSGRSTGS